MNEKSGEYVFFFLNLRVSLPGVMETVELETPCRHPLSHSITLANPLPNNGVTFYASCPCPEILMPPQFVIAPESSVSSHPYLYSVLVIPLVSPDEYYQSNYNTIEAIVSSKKIWFKKSCRLSLFIHAISIYK